MSEEKSNKFSLSVFEEILKDTEKSEKDKYLEQKTMDLRNEIFEVLKAAYNEHRTMLNFKWTIDRDIVFDEVWRNLIKGSKGDDAVLLNGYLPSQIFGHPVTYVCGQRDRFIIRPTL